MFSLILPCFNESGNINVYLSQLFDFIDKKKVENFEIIIVNDCSTDNSLELINLFKANCLLSHSIRIISHSINKGYGSSLKTGIAEAKNDTIVISDLDSTYPVKSIFDLLNLYLESKKNTQGFDMVIGQRTGKFLNESFLKGIFRYFLKKISEWSTGNKIYDVNSGLRVFSKKKIINFFPQLSNSFSFTVSSTLAYILSNLSVKWFKIDYHKRNGVSHVRLFRDTLRTLQYVVTTILFFNPLKLFLLVSLMFISISLLMFIIFFVNNSLIVLGISIMFLFISLISILFGFISVVFVEKNKSIKYLQDT